MNNNDFIIELLAQLEKKGSQKQINADIKLLESLVRKIQLIGTFSKGETKKELNAYIAQLGNQLKYIKIQAKIDNKRLQREIDETLRNLRFADINIGVNENKAKTKVQKVVAEAKAIVDRNPLSLNVELKKEKLNNQLTSYLNKNSRIRESSTLLDEADKLRKTFSGIGDNNSLKNATEQFQLFKSEVVATGFAGKSTTQKIHGMVNHVAKIGTAFGVASTAINQFAKSQKTLREIDTVMTEISKTSEMTKKQLVELGDASFDTANKYGQLAKNYLLGVQEMARSGYEDRAKELGEVSLLAQSAGDMTADMANNYILATDAAYKYGGSIEKLTSALDGANYVSNKNSASLSDIADGIRVSASYAANAGIEIDQLTAAEATMIATTKRSGSEIGRAFRSILLNLQQVSGEFDGEVIDEESLKKVEDRCHSLGVELEVLKDGVVTLRNPMEVLKELAQVYNSLPDNSADKQGLIADLGGKFHSNSLTALLSRWDMYEKMLKEYSQGSGSALVEAYKTADSWEGRVNNLQNTFDNLVNSLTNKDAVKGGISFLDNTIQAFEKLTDTLGTIPTLMTAINTSMATLNKDYGITQMFNQNTGKMDIQGNIMGIDFTAFKAQKKHFEEAAMAIEKWNAYLSAGKSNIDDFGESIVKNSAQFKEYLQTCSKDAPASLAGYKSYLNAAGVSTDALRLKTVLLTSAMSLGIGAAIQLAVGGIAKLIKAQEEARQAAQDAANAYSDTTKSISDYTKRYEELHSALLAAKGNEEETYNVKKQLLDLQTELNDKFGDEYGKLNLVTDAYKNQTDAIKAYNKEAANRFLNETPGLDIAEKEMTKDREYFLGSTGNLNEQYAKDIYDIVSRYQDKGIQLEEFTDKTVPGYKIKFLGDATQADKVINELETEIRNLQDTYSDNNFVNSLVENSKNRLIENNKVIEAQGKQYEEKLKAEIATNSSLTKGYNEATIAAQKYNEAVLKSEDPYNDENVQKAYDSFQKIKSEIQNDDSWNRYGAVMDDVWNSVDAKILDLNNDIKSNEDGISSFVEKIKGIDTVDLDAKIDSQDASVYDDLSKYADKYHMSVEELVDGLTKLGIVQSAVFDGDIAKTPDLSYSDTITQLEKLDDAFGALGTAYENFADKDKEITFDNLASLTEKFKDVSGIENYVKAIQDAAGNTEATQKAFDDLTSAYIAQTGILGQVNEGNANLIRSYLEEQGVANGAALVEAHLTVQRNNARLSALDLSNATYEEIAALVNEIGTTDEAKLAINQFYLEKLTANGIALSTSGDIDNIMSLVSACGCGISALKALSEAKQGLFTSFNNTLVQNNLMAGSPIGQDIARKQNEQAIADYKKQEADLIEKAQKEVNAALKGGSKSGSSANFVGNAKPSSGSKGSKEKEATIKDYNWYDTLIKRIDEKIQKLQDKATNAIGWKSQNKLQDTVFDELQGKLDTLNKEYDAYMEKANSIGLSDVYVQKIQNGTMEIEEVKGNEILTDMIDNYTEWYNKALDVKDSIDDVNKSILETKEIKLDNIINDYDKLIGLMESYTKYREKLVELRDRQGDTPEQDDYQDLIYDQMEIYHKLEEEYNALNKEFNSSGIEKGSDTWYEMKEQLADLQTQMIECELSVEDFKDAIIDLRFKPFDDLINKLDAINDEITDMNSLLGDDGLTLNGALTDKGYAAVALYGQQLINAKKQAAEYKAAIKALNATYENGDITLDEYNEKLHEYQSAQRDAALATKEARDAIIALREQAIEEEIDAMNELIQTKKDALDAETKLEEYRKKIAGYNKNTAALEKQIATLKLSNDRADQAQRLQLEQQLAEAKEELADYQRDYSIDAQKDALDKEGEAYEKAKKDEINNLKTNLDAQDALIEKYLGQVKDNYSTVYGVLTTYADTYNMDVTADLTNPFSSAEAATQSFQDAFSEMVSSIQYSIDSIDWGNMTSGLGSSGGSGSGDYEDITGQGKWKQNDTGWWYGNSDEDYFSDGYYNINGKTYGFNGDGYMITGWDDSQGDWHYFEPENGEMVKSNWRKSKKGDWYYLTSDGSMATDAAVKAKEGSGYYYVDDDGMWDGKTLTAEEIKKLGYDVAYKKGIRSAKAGIALTDEDGIGSEVILSRSGVLRQFQGGETVFNSEQTKRLWDLSKNRDMYKEFMDFGVKHDIPAVNRNVGLNINSPLVQIDGTGLSGREVSALIKDQVDRMPSKLMDALRYERL